jgi:RNA polymerase sigma-70 factor, ECF subfamily
MPADPLLVAVPSFEHWPMSEGSDSRRRGRPSAAPDGLPPQSDEPLRDIDGALVARALEGQAVAFELLVVKYQRRVAATVRRYVRDARIAEELTQEVFLRVYRALGEFSSDGNFAAWLFTIARNTASSYLRSGQNRQDDQPLEPDPDAIPPSGQRAAPPEEELMARELFALIDAEIAALPRAQREALLMREIDGLDYRSIAAATGQPVNTIKSHIFRAREALATGIAPLLAPVRNRRW